MGMANSDNESQIMYEYDLKEWAKKAPKKPKLNREMTEAEHALCVEKVMKWLKRKPQE